ncbi:MAG: ATP-binding protein [Candidatus Saccharibacteria bacterium]
MGKKKTGKMVFPQGEQIEQIKSAMQEFGLYGSVNSFEFFAKKTLEAHGTTFDFLIELFRHEYDHKESARVARWIIQSKLPKQFKTLEDYDFSRQPNIDPTLITGLASCRFITEGQNVIFLGPPGVGKTHLATALAYEAIIKGYETRFAKLNEFIEAVHKAADTSVIRLHRSLVSPELLILDDIDYYSTDQLAGQFLFTVLKERYENNVSTIITSNRNPKTWDIFGKPENTPAILDRLFQDDRAITINITSSSQRVSRIPELLA